MPAKKEDYETVFNKLFGTNIKWSKLALEELMELAVLFNHPEILLNKLGVAKNEPSRKRFMEAGLDFVRELAENWDGPLAQLARKKMSTEEPKEAPPKT